ncbi:MAG: phasin family protein [Gammaproteobacteria bacterium]|nr:phasin family protein [Gammaproteobacteria bacterium]
MDTSTYAATMEKCSKAAMEAMTELGEINAEIFAEVTTAQRALLSDLTGIGTDAMEKAKKIKGFDDVFSTNSGFFSAYNDTMLGSARAMADIMMSSRDKYQGWFEKSVKSASETAPAFSVVTDLLPKKKVA